MVHLDHATTSRGRTIRAEARTVSSRLASSRATSGTKPDRGDHTGALHSLLNQDQDMPGRLSCARRHVPAPTNRACFSRVVSR